MAGLVILLYHHFPILSCSKETVSELSRRKGISFLSAPAFLSFQALAAVHSYRTPAILYRVEHVL